MPPARSWRSSAKQLPQTVSGGAGNGAIQTRVEQSVGARQNSGQRDPYVKERGLGAGKDFGANF